MALAFFILHLQAKPKSTALWSFIHQQCALWLTFDMHIRPEFGQFYDGGTFHMGENKGLTVSDETASAVLVPQKCAEF